MKKIFLLIGFMLACNFFVEAQVRVNGPVNPSSPLDLYPTHIDTLGHGGFMAVRTKVIRDNIPPLRRKEGMLVYVAETDSLYQLKGGILNSFWTKYKLTDGSGSGSSGINNVQHSVSGTDINSSISADGLTLTLNIPDASPTARGVVSTTSQTFAGSKIFNDGVTVDGIGSNNYQSKLKLGINSSITSPNFSNASARSSKYLVVDENGTVSLAPGVNRYVTIQKVVDLTNLYDVHEIDYSDPLPISSNSSKSLYVDFSAELAATYGLSYWGAGLSIVATNYLNDKIFNHEVYYTTWIADVIYENSVPSFFIELNNRSNQTIYRFKNQRMLISVTFDLLDPYIDGWYFE